MLIGYRAANAAAAAAESLFYSLRDGYVGTEQFGVLETTVKKLSYHRQAKNYKLASAIQRYLEVVPFLFRGLSLKWDHFAVLKISEKNSTSVQISFKVLSWRREHFF